MSDLTKFLLARIAEDEAIARREGDYSYRQYHEQYCGWRQQEGYGEECQCGYPARVLADCEARRAIVKLHAGYWDDQCTDIEGQRFRRADFLCDTLKLLALPFADHPDFDPAWRI